MRPPLCRSDRTNDQVEVVSHDMPRTDGELDQCNVPAGQVLLIRDVPVTGDENGKASLFRRPDQVTIGQCVPTNITRCDYFVRGKGAAQRAFWSSRILTGTAFQGCGTGCRTRLRA
jgi:hypothetical protein